MNSDHSITRINGGLDTHNSGHGSPLVTNGLKSDSPASKHLAGLPGVSPGYHLYPPGGHRPPARPPPPHQDLLGRGGYPPYHQHGSANPSRPRLAQAAMVDPRMDPLLEAMYPFMESYSLLSRDPLREPKERELMHLNPHPL